MFILPPTSSSTLCGHQQHIVHLPALLVTGLPSVARNARAPYNGLSGDPVSCHRSCGLHLYQYPTTHYLVSRVGHQAAGTPPPLWGQAGSARSSLEFAPLHILPTYLLFDRLFPLGGVGIVPSGVLQMGYQGPGPFGLFCLLRLFTSAGTFLHSPATSRSRKADRGDDLGAVQ